MLSNRSHAGFIWMVTLIVGVLLACAGCEEARVESPAVVPLYGANHPDAIANQYFVIFSPPPAVTEDDIDRIQKDAQDLGGTVLHRYHLEPRGFAVRMPQEALKALRRDGTIEYIESDRYLYTTGVQTCVPWGLDRIDQDSNTPNGVYSYHETGEGVDVYIVDTGIHQTQTEFNIPVECGYCSIKQGSMGCPGSINAMTNCALDTKTWDDTHGHGTHLAGIVAGKTYGVAKRASLYAVKAFNDGCPKAHGVATDVRDGFEWIKVTHALHSSRPAVALLGASVGVGYHQDPILNLSDSIQDAVVTHDIVVVLPAGNDADNACDYFPGGHYYTDYSTVPPQFGENKAITVGALNDRYELMSNSNWGTCVDIFAPGEGVESIVPDNSTCVVGQQSAFLSGTSQAAAHVAGAAALLLEKDHTQIPEYITGVLLADANDTGDVGTGSPREALHTKVGDDTGSPPAPGTLDEDNCDDRGISCIGNTCNYCPGAQRCCEDPSNAQCPNDKKLRCNQGICSICGVEDTQCCLNNTCEINLNCKNDVCEACGAEGDPCCSKNPPCGAGLICNKIGSCEQCGAKGDPCCSDPLSRCKLGLVCNNTSQTCSCGEANELCCGGSDPCTAPYECNGGVCGNCGGNQEVCCTIGQQCDDEGGFDCVSNKCEVCGFSNGVVDHWCCDGHCNPGFNCTYADTSDILGKCKACGKSDQACCVVWPFCQDGLDCINNQCKACGKAGLDCCVEGEPCQPGHNCINNKCEACGDIGQACCQPSLTCDTGLACYDNNGTYICDGLSCSARCMDDHLVPASIQGGKMACNAWANSQCITHSGKFHVRYNSQLIYCGLDTVQSSCWVICNGSNELWQHVPKANQFGECDPEGLSLCNALGKTKKEAWWCW